MADAAIIRAEYVEWKMVKTRKALQIIFEVPLEQQEHVMGALGIPMPDKSTPVAIARLTDEATADEPPAMLEPPANDDRPSRPLSQISAFLCTVVAFRRFLGPEGINAFEMMPTEDQAADYVRESCGVRSRAEFDTDESAAANFRHLRSQYNAWMRAA